MHLFHRLRLAIGTVAMALARTGVAQDPDMAAVPAGAVGIMAMVGQL